MDVLEVISSFIIEIGVLYVMLKTKHLVVLHWVTVAKLFVVFLYMCG